MTRKELIQKLEDVLCQYKDEKTSVSLNLIFNDVGLVVGDHEELCWNEDLQQFIPVWS